jgi:ferredoxin
VSKYLVVVDQALCGSFGECAELAPNVIALDRGGKASPRTLETDEEAVIEAARACPMGAIHVLDAATGDRAA